MTSHPCQRHALPHKLDLPWSSIDAGIEDQGDLTGLQLVHSSETPLTQPA